MKKRILSAALAVCMLFGSAAALPQGFMGESAGITASAEQEGDYTYSVKSDGTVTITKYNGSGGAITLPQTLGGKTVTEVGSNVFFKLSANKTVTSIVVPSTVKQIDASAFRGCQVLTSITLPNSVTSIGNYAFMNCTALTTITIPASVTSLSKSAFDGCTKLTSINVNASNSTYASYDGAVYNKAKTQIICYPQGKTSIELPGTMATVPADVFESGISSVKLNEGTTTIKFWAFIKCGSMKSITIPKSVTSIENQSVGYYHKEDTDPVSKISGFVIYGYTGSAAETYAKNNGITFQSIGTVCQHTYGTPTWTWSGYTSAAAAFTCTKCSTKQTVNATITNAVTKAATCSATGVRTYTATASFGGKSYTNTKTETIAVNSNAHSWNTTATWTWSGYTSATAKVTCKNNSSHTQSANATITSAVTKAATCSATGVRTYTAKATVNGTSFTDTKTETIAVNSSAHSWKAPTYSWSSDNKTCTATRVCANNANHKESETVTASVSTSAASCTAGGSTTYTATFKNSAFAKQTKSVSVAALGHSYTTTVVSPTCTTKGYTLHKCTRCSYSYQSDYTDMTEHSWGDWVTVKPATETTTGTRKRVCSVCQKEETATIPVLAHTHTYYTQVVAPTCETQGYTKHTCTSCGDSYNDNYKNALGHSLSETVVAPTCTTKGYTLHKCTRTGCNYSYQSDFTDIADHTWSKWSTTKQPACLESGEETRTCSVCSKKETRAVSALGHDYKGTVFAPTCTEQGYTLYKCSRCSNSYKGSYTDPAGHKWSAWTQTKAATCTADGSEERSCSVCSQKETRAVTKLGHDYQSTVYPPTCTQQGYTLHTCSRCASYYKDTYTSATGHSYKATVVPPSCTDKGYTVHTCEKCGDSYKDNDTSAAGHSWGAWETTKAATCLEAGSVSRKCTACGTIETQPVEKLGHDYKATLVDPTCTEEGCILHKCSRCGDFYKDTYTAPTGHSFGSWTVTEPASCTESGMKKRTCSVCGQSETATVAPTGHSYTSTVTAPTCTEKGYTTYTCSSCAHTYTDNYKDALGHSWGAWATTKAATCTETGEQKRTCTRCKQSETKTLAKLEHSYTKKVIAPTCTEKGYTVYTCSKCGNAYTDNYTDALGHSFGAWTVTKAATCTQDGSQTRKCTRTGCTHSETQTITKLGHSYKDTVVKPTCTEQGYTTHTCSRCKNSYTDSYTEPLGHSFGAWTTTKAATCTQDGSQTRKCTRTGCTHSETQTITKLGHSYKDTVVKPTCTEQGYTEHTCSRCKDSYKDTYTAAQGHRWGVWITTVTATESREGQMTRTCSVCKQTETKVIPKLGHNYVKTVTQPTCTAKGYTTYKCSDCGDSYVADYVDPLGHAHAVSKTVAPTCTEQGYTVYVCTRCNHSYNDNFTDPTGHKWSFWSVSTPATCTQDGVQSRKCSACSQTETAPIKATGHDYTKTVIAPTCTEKGSTLYSCKKCNHSYTDDYTDALGHSFDSGKITKAATCLEDGVRTFTCTRKGCGSTKTEAVAKLGHDYVPTIVAPTCTERGYTLYTCSRCSDFYKSNYTEATGHKFGSWSVTKPATCSSEGTQTHTCSVCKATESKAISKLSHKYTSKTVAPTCTEKGYTTYTCSLCGDSYNDNFKNAAGHSWGAWSTTTAAECEKDGEQTRKCKNCTETQTQTVVKLGHSYTSKTIAPTCTAQGYTEYTCSRCKHSYKDSYKQALGHKFGDWVTVDATVTKEGSKTRKCSACSQTETLTLPKPSIRLYGKSRYDTAFAIADRLKKENGGKAFENIIIASGTDFADALSATYLAKIKGAPILITSAADSAMANVAAYIKDNAKSGATVYIIGGTGAVPAQMESKLGGFKTVRLAGKNRYLTNLAVLKEADLTNEELLVAFGGNYADALSSSAVGKPIFLVAGNGLTADQKAFLATLKSTTATIIGGTGAVSTGIEGELKKTFKTVTRLGGKNRYETSVLVAERYFDNPPTIAVAYGLNYPDGLCGGPLAMTYHCPLILTVSNNFAAAKEYAKKIKATNTVTFGGPSLITDDALKGIIGE